MRTTHVLACHPALAGAALLLAALAAGPAAAQAPASATTYTGPRFPGGPDSLRSALRRVAQAAGAVPAGQVLVKVELDDAGRVRKATFLPPPPGSVASQLVRRPEVKAAAEQLRQLPAWQPGQAVNGPRQPLPLVLPLTFGGAGAPFSYSDENPLFPLPAPRDARYLTFPYPLLDFTQRQVRYPAADLRAQVQGTVYAYFEVSETGVLEQLRIAGSVSPTLDAEVLRVLQTIPSAQVPPRQQGRPVRVAYVLPFNFHIQ